MKLIKEQELSWDEFSGADKDRWKTQILQDIKAATTEEKLALYERNMKWQTYEGITIEPFYTKEDLSNISPSAIQLPEPGWLNRQFIQVSSAKEANITAIEAISNGATALLLDFSQVAVQDINLSQALHNIKLSHIPVSFLLPQVSAEFLTALKQLAPYQWKGSFVVDPLAHYTSKKLQTPEISLDELAQAIIETREYPHFRPLTICGHQFHEAGASAVQELAFLLNMFVEYTHRLSDKGVAVQDIFLGTELSMSVSTNYFIEIAKLRALRLLWQQLASAYSVEQSPLFIHAQTARWNKPEVDQYNNIIRGTIEAMVAVLGGCSALTVFPYNHQAEDAFAARIARNISLILKEESYFDKALDIASGSYYIEHLTHTFAREAWKLFGEVESKGGYLQALEEGFIHTQISKVREAKEADFQSGRQILVGVNKYTPTGEQVQINTLYNKL